MSEPVDVYSDQLQVTTAVFGCTINFMRSNPTPPAPGTAPQIERLATVRMSLEHLKVMVFILHRQMRVHEDQTGISIPIPPQVLNGLQVGLEDWEKFWRG